MSDISFADVSVTMFAKGLTALIGILRKAATHADAETFPSARLVDDMHPLSFQVQAVSDLVTRSLGKILEAPHEADMTKPTTTMADIEEPMRTVADMIERADKALALVKSLDVGVVEGREKVQIHMPLPMGSLSGKQLILDLVLPNFFFHLQTAYAILRMKGVPLGKDDYIVPFKEFVLAGEKDGET